jgi:hypothetical protein
LPDGIFSNQKSNVGIFYAHLEYITVILEYFIAIYEFCGNLVQLSRFGIVPRKIWQP